MADFAEMLRSSRNARSLTQEELAERAGLTRKAISALERGERRSPYPHTVRALAEALDLDSEERADFVALVPGRAPQSIGSHRRSRANQGQREAPGSAGPAAPTTAGAPISSTAGLLTESEVIGRDEEIARVCAFLRAPDRRQLVTVTGSGGVGKTTVALTAAASLGDAFSGGVVSVGLAEIGDVSRVIPAIAAALGVAEGMGETARTLVPLVRGRQLLIVLDNLEHVVEAASELSLLVTGCPELQVLATSRAPLRIRAEQEVRVAPLADADAMTLFYERARAAGAALDVDTGSGTAEAVATLCDHADGLPLAIELAASAAALLGPTTLVVRLAELPVVSRRDLPARQRSMAATVNWSYDLLGADARALLARLSVSRGGVTVTLVEAMGGDGCGDALAALVELLEHSMIVRAGHVAGVERFRLLEPIAQHVSGRLRPEERTAARSRLAGAVLELTSGLADELRGTGYTPAVRLLEAGMGNLRIAVEVLFEDERIDELAVLMWSVWEYLSHCGHGREGIAWIQRLRHRPMADLARARWLVAWGALEYVAGGSSEARELLADALVIARRTGDDALAVEAAVLAAAAAISEYDLSAASELIGDAEAHGTRAEVPVWLAYSQAITGEIALMRGELEEADRVLRAAEATSRRIENPTAIATALLFRSVASTLHGRNAEAAILAAEATEMAAELAARWTMSFAIPTLARVALRIGEHDTAAWLLGVSSFYASEHALTVTSPLVQQVAEDREILVEHLGRAAFDEAWDAGRRARTSEVVAAARAITRRCQE